MGVRPPTSAVCYRHPDRSTYLRCSNCDRPICIECTNDVPVGQKCPECAAPATRSVSVATGQSAPATVALLVMSVLVFAATFYGDMDQELLARFGQFNLAVAAGEWWRIFTAAFLHAGFTHLLFNMWALWIFGRPLEAQIGSASFTALYFASAAAGGAAAYLLGDPRDLLVGASGAIFGLFGAWLFASYRSRHTRWGSAQFRNLLVLLGLNAFLAVAVPQISWQGHAGGLVAGFLIAAAWSKAPSTPATRVLIAAGAGILALVLVLVG